MQTKFQRFGAMVLSAALALSLSAPALAVTDVVAPSQESKLASAVSDGTFLRGTFTFKANENTEDRTDTFIYSDDYFKTSSYDANEHLATMSMQLASASISSRDADYPKKSQNVTALLDVLGFQQVEVNEWYTKPMEQNSMGVAVGYKNLSDGSVLLAIVPRSAGYEKEWGGNFIIGNGEDDGLHEGFRAARNIALEFAKGYVTDEKRTEVFADKTVKVWIVGYSRGAATANLIGAAIADDAQNALGVPVNSENIYDYNFATPATVQTAGGVKPSGDQYKGIHNYLAEYDPVPMAPLADWGFTRYGQEVPYTVGSKTRMLRFLQKLNPEVYDKYMNGGDPDDFNIYTLGEGLTPIPSGETTTQKAFLEGRLKMLTDHVVPDRTTYVEGYQNMISALTGFYLGGSDETVNQFNEGISADKTKLAQLVLLLALYDWAEQYQASDAEKTAAALKETLPQTGDTGYLATADYQSLREKITDKDKLQTFLSKPDNTEGTQQKSPYITQTEDIMKAVLEAGFTEAKIDANDPARTAILSNVSGLTKFVAYFVFGTDTTLKQLTDSENTSEAIANALVKKIKTAATLIGNSGKYMRVHKTRSCSPGCGRWTPITTTRSAAAAAAGRAMP